MLLRGEGVPQDVAEARELFAKAAAKGNAEAQRRLGVLYRDGVGVEVDGRRAKDWFDKACQGGLQEGCAERDLLKEKGF